MNLQPTLGHFAAYALLEAWIGRRRPLGAGSVLGLFVALSMTGVVLVLALWVNAVRKKGESKDGKAI